MSNTEMAAKLAELMDLRRMQDELTAEIDAVHVPALLGRHIQLLNSYGTVSLKHKRANSGSSGG